jgi:hypothetical protein
MDEMSERAKLNELTIDFNRAALGAVGQSVLELREHLNELQATLMAVIACYRMGLAIDQEHIGHMLVSNERHMVLMEELAQILKGMSEV